MTVKSEQKAYVLVDRRCSEPRDNWARTSLWTSVLPADAEEISISDEKRCSPPKAVRIDSADLVIVNWDAANGDYVCGSDDVFMYFQTRRDRRDALLRGHGKLLCEFQSGKGVLHQGAYDAIFGEGEVQVEEAKLPPEVLRGTYLSDEFKEKRRMEEEKWTNTTVKPNKWYKWFHPVINSLPNSLVSRYDSERPLFNFDETPQEGFFWYRHKECAFKAWFCNWKKGWVPVLIAVPRHPWPWYKRWFKPNPAVLLAKCHEDGLMLASTMWMAVPGMEQLVLCPINN
jgi:hypothetical protein